jgi:integrase/recombinase XerD
VAQLCLQSLHQTLVAKHYAIRTIRNYTQEMRFLFGHYHDVYPHAITQQQIISYINFIIKEHGVGREKCHQVAQSCSFYFRHVFPTPFVIPSAFYHRKQHKLPQVFTQDQVAAWLSVIRNQKHRVVVSLFYGTGLRMNELMQLKLCDIDSKSYQVKVVTGKGAKTGLPFYPKHCWSHSVNILGPTGQKCICLKGRPGVRRCMNEVFNIFYNCILVK